jgi:hypothetical protein
MHGAFQHVFIVAITTRKKVNSGGQIGAVGLELPPLPRLPAVMSAVQTAAVSLQENMKICT